MTKIPLRFLTKYPATTPAMPETIVAVTIPAIPADDKSPVPEERLRI